VILALATTGQVGQKHSTESLHGIVAAVVVYYLILFLISVSLDGPRCGIGSDCSPYKASGSHTDTRRLNPSLIWEHARTSHGNQPNVK
jgi:hypothetical protein